MNDKDIESLDIYPKESKTNIRYELQTLPLQQEVSIVRKYLCTAYDKTKTVTSDAQSSFNKFAGAAKDTLASYGLKDTRLQYLTQGSAMGGAMLLGYIIGRRSHFKKIAYPVVGGAIVGGAIYMSDRGRQENCIQSLNKLLQRVWPSTRK